MDEIRDGIQPSVVGIVLPTPPGALTVLNEPWDELLNVLPFS